MVLLLLDGVVDEHLGQHVVYVFLNLLVDVFVLHFGGQVLAALLLYQTGLLGQLVLGLGIIDVV